MNDFSVHKDKNAHGIGNFERGTSHIPASDNLLADFVLALVPQRSGIGARGDGCRNDPVEMETARQRCSQGGFFVPIH